MSRTASRLLLPYASCLVVVVALLPLEDQVDWTEVAIAAALQLVTGLRLAGGENLRAHAWLRIACLVAFFISIALLRDGVGSTAGFGPLVFLPVMWAALERRRGELMLALLGIALLYAIPMLAVGSPQYPNSGLRGGALLLVVATAMGVAVLSLVERLRLEVDHSATILGAMSEGYALTRDGEIVTVNPALCAITGFSEAELIGCRPPFPFWPADRLEECATQLRAIVEAGGGEFAMQLARRDGTRFPAEIAAVATDLGDGSRGFLNTVRDVTERRGHEDAMRRHAEQLAAIADVVRVVGHSDPLEARQTICATALALCESAHAVSVWEPALDGGLVTTATRPEMPSPQRIAADRRIHGAHVVMETGEPLFVADALTSPHCDRRIVELVGAQSVLFCPIADATGVRGALAISFPEPGAHLTDGDHLLIGVLAGEAALAMQRADLLGRLDELTRTDELTGLPNRRAWDELLTHELAAARRNGKPLAVAMLDLDFFKHYNDENGHLAGDHLLRRAAHAWSHDLRATDVLARWGGEEFALLLPGCDGPHAATLIERLRGTLPDGVTFSAGVSCTDGSTAPRTLVDAADQALYLAKANGRDRVVVG
ncbi:MAG TPA: diguanylate cyclase [Baekduia sp.]|nr:diguanylate cyclase [Baekduia sp.]